MTQQEALWRVMKFEEFVTLKWDEYGHTMKHCLLQSRRRFIKELLDIQIKEFDRNDSSR